MLLLTLVALGYLGLLLADLGWLVDWWFWVVGVVVFRSLFL